MINRLKNIDRYAKNVIFVFLGTSLVSFFNLLYQLLIAHSLIPADFAAFNSLLAIFMLFSVPLGIPLQMVVAKYSAECIVDNQPLKMKGLLSNFLKKVSLLAIISFCVFYFASAYIIGQLQIPSVFSGYLMAMMIAVAWIIPVFMGALQGIELFKWMVGSLLVTALVKLGLAFIFVRAGLNISGALGAFLIASFVGLLIASLPLIKRRYLSIKLNNDDTDYKQVLLYLLPVVISYFCFLGLVSFDMILVKYYFPPHLAGLYSLAQVVGKIFLFLPWAITIVMFPRTSQLNAEKKDTLSTLKRSVNYGLLLCALGIVIYNIFPGLILKILTGKSFVESIRLGRLFSVSMSFFALVYVLINYFLSLKDLRFLKYLITFLIIQCLGIIYFHHNLTQVQLILCVNAILLFLIHIFLAYKVKPTR